MDEILSMDEIKARYAPDWVLIGEPKTDDWQRLLSGRVLFRAKTQNEVYEKAIELRLDHFAFRYLGEIPDDMVFLL